MYRSGQLSRCCTVEPNCSGLSARLTDASVIRERALKTYEPSCVPGAARPFFIPVVHSPLGAVGYVTAPELSSRKDRARSHGTHDSTGAHLGRKVRSEAEEHVAAPEGSEPQDMWQHRSPPRQGGEVQS
jgi:hypothetical protein